MDLGGQNSFLVKSGGGLENALVYLFQRYLFAFQLIQKYTQDRHTITHKTQTNAHKTQTNTQWKDLTIL